MLVVASIEMIDVDEGIEVPELKLEGGANSMVIDGVGAAREDFFSVLQTALVVIGEVKDEEITKIKADA